MNGSNIWAAHDSSEAFENTSDSSQNKESTTDLRVKAIKTKFISWYFSFWSMERIECQIKRLNGNQFIRRWVEKEWSTTQNKSGCQTTNFSSVSSCLSIDSQRIVWIFCSLRNRTHSLRLLWQHVNYKWKIDNTKCDIRTCFTDSLGARELTRNSTQK